MLSIHDVELMHSYLGKTIPTDGWVYELKYDGYRLLVGKQAGSVVFLTRRRKVATDWFPILARQVAQLPGDFILDTEVCALDAWGRPDFEQMRRASGRRSKDIPLGLFPFDLIAKGTVDCRTLSLLKRKALLQKLLEQASMPSIVFVDYIDHDGVAFFREAVRAGLEGIFAKRSSSPYRAGRSRDWLKFKAPGIHDGWRRRRSAGIG
jgi:bifunctional non-homologous end joining protein LigD